MTWSPPSLPRRRFENESTVDTGRGIGLFVITAIFAVINMDPVQVNFLFTKTTAPLILVIVFSTVLGD
ncbi:lipopolysaccharide assembly protein LapA domain-containing protein [Paenibacillus larvae]|nr:lipopolysaccharide assembly protein LapA domain-containing protein [Paenibacillus larvae]MDT2273969.1 lipopolysaccharide assembly protein LapA domain-containing protein [Paenibacillus larvae]